MEVNKYIFREYDIRGRVSDDFPPDVVQFLGKGFGTYVKRQGGKEITLSGDVRLTTPELMDYFKQGILSTGVDVIILGILPTPVNYYSMFALDVSGAAQITGSHNPPQFNGFKLSLNRQAVFGSAIAAIRDLIVKEDFESGEGSQVRYQILGEYRRMILDKIQLERPLKVAMDCGNATAALVAPDIFKGLEIELEELYCEVDGTFPNHHPDPTVAENLADLIALMKGGGYDLGVAFDGDGDRVGVVDETGAIVWADQLLALFLPEVISPGDEVLFDVKCSQALEEMILKYQGVPVMWKTGHSLIKQKMAELGCKLGGEMSGHIFFADDYYGYDDALYVAARAVQMLSRTPKSLSELVARLPRYHSTPEMRLGCPSDEEKFRIAREAADYFRSRYDCNEIDGVRIQFGDGWGLVRASNTQPVIVCRFEAQSRERMEEIKDLVLSRLQTIGTVTLEAGH